MPYRCCAHCANDPVYHQDNPPDSHDTTCSTPGNRCASGGDDWAEAAA